MRETSLVEVRKTSESRKGWMPDETIAPEATTFTPSPPYPSPRILCATTTLEAESNICARKARPQATAVQPPLPGGVISRGRRRLTFAKTRTPRHAPSTGSAAACHPPTHSKARGGHRARRDGAQGLLRHHIPPREGGDPGRCRFRQPTCHVGHLAQQAAAGEEERYWRYDGQSAAGRGGRVVCLAAASSAFATKLVQ